MQYAIELFFDEENENQIVQLAEHIAEAKLSTKWLEWKMRPHITLACFNDVDEEKSTKMLKVFAETHYTMPAYLGSVGMFTDTKTIFAAPIMTSSMYDVQRELHKAFREFDTKGWEWYLPDRWVPHCGIALMSEDAEENYYKACDLVLREFQKTSGEFLSVGLVKVSFPVQEICTFDLKRKD